MRLSTGVLDKCGDGMLLIDYLNHLYDSDNLHDYNRKINPNTKDIPESDKDTLVLILDIIRLNEKYKEKENVFEQFNSERLPDLKRITRDDLSPILSLDLGSLPLPIRARIADFLWVTIKDPNSGQIAISSYLDLYDSLWDEEQWPNCIDAIYRAINISCGLGKKGKTIKTA